MNSLAEEYLVEMQKQEQEAFQDGQEQSPCGDAPPAPEPPAPLEEAAPPLADTELDPPAAQPNPVETEVEEVCCAKCRLPVHDADVLAKAKGNNVTCKACNCKRSTLSQLFGHWPIELFKELPPQQQLSFWQSGAKGKDGLELLLKSVITTARMERTNNFVEGKYLPLSVYRAKGFSTEEIESKCTDKQEHPLLGTTYKVDIIGFSKEDIASKVTEDLFHLKVVNKPSDLASPKLVKHSKSSKKRQRSSSSSSSSSPVAKAPQQGRKAKAVPKAATKVAAKEAATQKRRQKQQAAAEAKAAQKEKAAEAASKQKESKAAMARIMKQKKAAQDAQQLLMTPLLELRFHLSEFQFDPSAPEQVALSENASDLLARADTLLDEVTEALKSTEEVVINVGGAKQLASELKSAGNKIKKLRGF